MRYFLKLIAVLSLTSCADTSSSMVTTTVVTDGNDLEQCIAWYHYLHSMSADGAIEIDADAGDGFDGNCDGRIDEADYDNDGVSTGDGDCDDNHAKMSPNEIEACDGVDNDCDGEIDNHDVCDDDLVVCAIDRDRDNFGDCDHVIVAGMCYQYYLNYRFAVQIDDEEQLCDSDDFDPSTH